MNIFVLDESPKQAALWHSDVHVNKMLLESCQLLCTAHHVSGNVAPYKEAYKNHPCAIWTRQSEANYDWLLALANELSLEYTRRTFLKKGIEKIHACQTVLNWLNQHKPNNYKYIGLTPFALAIRDEIKSRCYVKNDYVQTYRNYYLLDKRGGRHATWTLNKPSWWIDDITKLDF